VVAPGKGKQKWEGEGKGRERKGGEGMTGKLNTPDFQTD